MATIEPVVVAMKADDLVYLRAAIADLPPPAAALGTAATLNGWTAEMLILGHVLGAVADMLRAGALELLVTDTGVTA